MLFGGSWDVKTFEQAQFDWGVFPVPAPRGRQTQVIFQPDIGMGVNRSTSHPAEAQLFVKWLMDKRSTPIVTTNLPGFYPLGNVEAGTSPNTHDVEFLSMAANNATDVRWIFIGISDHYPRASDIVREALNEMAAQKLPAETAAKRLQEGLAEWYTPAQICR
jgi:raffinose/stachyose/melibiose transport system substrate-binding protein